MKKPDVPIFAPGHVPPSETAPTVASGDRGAIRIGIGGWIFPEWRGPFYPPKLVQRRELEYASRVLSTIEINGTYYNTPSPASVEKWHDETPEHFVFAVKGPKTVSEMRTLAYAGAQIERFLSSGITRLGDKLGPINWQFPPWHAFEAQDFGAFLKLLPSSADGLRLRHAVEIRHASFACEAFAELAREHGVAVVLGADSTYPQIHLQTADFMYVRAMGTQIDEPTGYAPDKLDQWAGRIRAWANGTGSDLPLLDGKADGKPRDAFFYVISGAKVRNPLAAQALIERLGGAPRLQETAELF
ncbi:DUF72 domain-containing protein [Brachymonas denitrificans]|uniref:DUF72 domain-containing protein n=1 Tax=Brachymonas denitrificans TaxID=28220 RepID=UPI002B001304|nr:DUF72 domain-containing protein [Brachymonas denitrificans]